MNFSDRYPLKPFQVTDFQKLKRVIEAYPLATLISQQAGYPLVSQVPLIFDRDGVKLLGHFDNNNPHCDAIGQNTEIYILFNGPNHYMTPSIYPDRQYPGWNYVAVHVKGRISLMPDEQALSDLLLRTAERHEPPGSGYTLTPQQKNYHIYLQMITGFEIEIVDIKGVFKLAQDKGEPHIEHARQHLNKMAQRDISQFLTDLLD